MPIVGSLRAVCRTLRRLLPAACAVATLSGCGLFAGAPDPTVVIADIQADKDVNPNAAGVANPIVVQVDLLRTKDAFASGEFQPLYTQIKQVLAADLVRSDEYELRPGDTRTVKIDDAKDATTLGVLAAYSNIGNAKWHDTYDLKPHQVNKVVVHVGLGAVELQTKKEGGFWFLW